MEKTKSPDVTLRNMRFRTSVVKMVEEQAKYENRSFNNMVETILMRHVASTNELLNFK